MLLVVKWLTRNYGLSADHSTLVEMQTNLMGRTFHDLRRMDLFRNILNTYRNVQSVFFAYGYLSCVWMFLK